MYFWYKHSTCYEKPPKKWYCTQVNLQRWGISLGIKTIRRISESFANTSLAIREEWLNGDDPSDTPLITENESFEGKRIMISADVADYEYERTNVEK